MGSVERQGISICFNNESFLVQHLHDCLISLLVSDFLRSVWNVVSTSVAIVVLSSELDVVQKNDNNKQLQEVEQETLETTTEEYEIICDDTVKMETVVEIIHQEQKTASLTFHPVVLLPKFDVRGHSITTWTR